MFGLEYTNWFTNLVILQIYSFRLFRYAYAKLKGIYNYIVGTSELYRISHRKAISLGINDIPIKVEAVEKEDPLDLSQASESLILARNHSAAIELDAEILLRMDWCFFYSTELDEIRKRFESWHAQFDIEPTVYVAPGHGEKFEQLFKSVLKLKFKTLPNDRITKEELVLRAGMTTIFATFQLQHDLNSKAATPYDNNLSQNETRLMELWNTLVPNEPLKARFTTQWQQIGFQGSDPSTDFRAMGMLAFENLHYFATKHTNFALEILKQSHDPVHWFGFSLVGIHLTAYLLRLVRTRNLQYHFYKYGVEHNVFREIFCFTFRDFADYWRNDEKASVMEFNRIFKSFQVHFELKVLQRQHIFLDPKYKLRLKNE